MNGLIVVKIGGAILNDLTEFWNQINTLATDVVIVHGGGVQSTSLARQLGHTPTIIQGRRVTGDLDLKIAEWTMRGELNIRLVAEASAYGIPAVGLSGADGSTVKVRRREPWRINGEKVDFGWVGEIVSIDTSLLKTLLNTAYIPIIAPLGIDDAGQRYNVNADTVACELAVALRAKELLLVTESGGVLLDVKDSASLLQKCSPADEHAGISEGWISGGMAVKIQTARSALKKGVPRVWILGPDDLIRKQYATAIIP